MKYVALHNLGCKVNSYEMDAMRESLEQSGYGIVDFAPGADVYIINTCTVTNIADRKSRQMLHKAKKMNPDAVVVAAGCYVQTGTEAVEKDDCVDLVVGNNKKKDIVPILNEYFAQKEQKKKVDKTLGHRTVLGEKEDWGYEEMSLSRAGEHTRAHIKIQDGCNQFCSYCIIPYARGRVRSRKKEDILREVRTLVEKGYREIVVTGIHLSSYGLDFVTEPDGEEAKTGLDPRSIAYEKGYLLQILREINAVEGLERIRLGSLEPRIITEEFVRGLTGLDKLCPHFHLSLQSGCDGTLKRMNRHYTTEEFRQKTELLRQAFDAPAITTDVIVGFPGETEEEFETTCSFLESIAFYEMHVFKYSKRQGTVAAGLPDQIEDRIKTIRSNRLLQMSAEQSAQYRQSMLGTRVEVLFEEEKVIDGQICQVGFTPTYVKAAVKTGEDLSNKIVQGKALSLLENEYLLLEI